MMDYDGRMRYSDADVFAQIDFNLRQSGRGCSENDKILDSLYQDRRDLLKELTYIADGDGNIDQGHVQRVVEKYEKILGISFNQEHIESIRDRP